jgi:hypothetical protein
MRHVEREGTTPVTLQHPEYIDNSSTNHWNGDTGVFEVNTLEDSDGNPVVLPDIAK